MYSPLQIQKSKVTGDTADGDGILHEVIIEHIEGEDKDFIEEDEAECILGCDDVEMKQEVRISRIFYGLVTQNDGFRYLGYKQPWFVGF